MDSLPLDDDVMAHYALEAAHGGFGTGGMLEAKDYGSFLNAHIGHLAGRRHLKRDWPADLASAMRHMSLADIARIAARAGDFPDKVHKLVSGISAMDFLRDWYRVRMGGDLGLDAIDVDRRTAYETVAAMFRELPDADAGQQPFQRLLRMYDRYISGLPSRDFTIDLETGAITSR
jgi:hypothetical protein